MRRGRQSSRSLSQLGNMFLLLALGGRGVIAIIARPPLIGSVSPREARCKMSVARDIIYAQHDQAMLCLLHRGVNVQPRLLMMPW